MDPYLCCLLGICCPPLAEEQFKKLVKIRMKRSGVPQEEAERAVRFDLDMIEGMRKAAAEKSPDES